MFFSVGIHWVFDRGEIYRNLLKSINEDIPCLSCEFTSSFVHELNKHAYSYTFR